MGFVFNIENVVMRNGDVPPEVAGVIGSLVRRGIPVAYVTNAPAGGGFGDVGQKEALVARMLDHAVPVSDYQVCVRHAPFRYLVKTLHLGDRNVLMVGGQGAQEVHRLAAACGFGKAWTPVTFRGASAVQIAAIVVLSAPADLDLAGDLELVGSILASSPETRLYFCNEDFERATNFQFPTINCSAFMKMLADYWRARDGASRWLTALARQFPPVDNYGVSMDASLDARLDNINRLGYAYDPLLPDHGFPHTLRTLLHLQTISLVTDNVQRELPGLERHVSSPQRRYRPAWKALVVGQVPVAARGSRPEPKYREPYKAFRDAKSAILWALEDHDQVDPESFVHCPE